MTMHALDGQPLDDEVVDQRIRLVVYGPSTGGKTTTARALSRILASPVIDATEDELGRTLDFDWLEFEGGSRNGAPVKVQLLTVPGHDPRRRVELLKVADVVLFVADTTQERLDHSVDLFAEMVEEIERLDLDPSVLVQANKRDQPSALPMETVRRRLDLGPDERVIETVATTGEGVRMAFVFAMRHGIERLDRRNEDGEALDPDALRAMLDAADRRPDESVETADTADTAKTAETAETLSTVGPSPVESPLDPRPSSIAEPVEHLEPARLEPRRRSTDTGPTDLQPAGRRHDTGPATVAASSSADVRLETTEDDVASSPAHQPPPPTGAPIEAPSRPSRWKQLLGR